MRGLIYLFALFVLSCNHPESEKYNREHNSSSFKSEKAFTAITNNDNSYKVVGVKDGDTFELLKDEATIVVRFAHIDCPEKKQPFGQKAKQFVSDNCFGENVTLIHNNKYDRYHRLIAEVILEDGRNLNKLLVENGLAWHYKKYSKDKSYAELETIARQNKIGLWTDTNALNPDIWRH
jgi:micrococcal nuclease